MPTRKSNVPANPAARMFAANQRINQFLIEHLDPAAWRAKPPGNVRTIAAIFTHMHNVRAKWIRLTVPQAKVLAQLNRAHCTPQQVCKAMAESGARCEEMLAEVDAGRIRQFVRDGWAKPWPASPALLTEMLSYMLAHEVHHRGQVQYWPPTRLPASESRHLKYVELGKT
ncbi:MAG: DinB family protein [Terracidiphilus sp.]